MRDLVAHLRGGRRTVVSGAAGSLPAMLAGIVAQSLGRTVLLVAAHHDDADDAQDELEGLGVPADTLPAIQGVSGEGGAVELHAQRARLLYELRRVEPASGQGRVIVAPVHALMQPAPDGASLDALFRTVREGEELPPAALLDWLDRAGYSRTDAVDEPGDVAVRGGIVDIFPAGGGAPFRLDYFGDEIERIAEIDLDTMGSDRRINQAQIPAADPSRFEAAAFRAPNGKGSASGEGSAKDRDQGEGRAKDSPPVLASFPRDTIVLLHEIAEITEQAKGYYERVYDASKGILEPRAMLADLNKRAAAIAELNQYSRSASGADATVELPASPLPLFEKETAEAVRQMLDLAPGGRVSVACQNEGERSRLLELVEAAEPAKTDRVEPLTIYLHRGFVWRDGAWALVPYNELLGRFTARRRPGGIRAGRATDAFMEFQPGDIVVHADHGIARFVGLELIKPKAVQGRHGKRQPEPEEYLTLEFAGRSRLHVPATQIDLVQRYIGGFKGKPQLSTLGGTRWKSQKARVAESVRELAAELLRVRAARQAVPGHAFPADTPWMKEFEDEFPYDETEDQLAAVEAIKRDMTSPRPMDRLLCGDVGFGKTEIAIRAVFKCIEAGKQAAVLVPTTVLSEQHERTFTQRFAGFPFKIAAISRFKTDAEVKKILTELRAGRVDVIIGTHRLLSQDVHFADLGLVVIDEEQRFGVEHKESLLRLRMTVDVLTLSATPIPRTLHMAMLGIRDISSLTTAPADRRAVVTEVAPFSEKRIADAIRRELAREGQVFFVHNRVHNIRTIADQVAALALGARIVVGHGQMPPRELEEVMLKFIRREADILVSTTIIESGIDIPTANTMFINDAHRFGLAELHQLRGRVGRYKHRAYCYLLLPAHTGLSDVAKRRLKAIEEFSMLGAGFKIAMRDLEIRGAGNLLGPEQSGHIAAVGYDMYCRLLEQAVRDLKAEPEPVRANTVSIELGRGGTIPRPYIPSDARRMEAYRRLATASTAAELESLAEDLSQAYGQPPTAVQRLLELAELRVLANTLGVRSVTLKERDIVLRAERPAPVAAALAGANATVRVLPPASGEKLCEVYYRPPESYLEPDTLLRVLRTRFGSASGRQPEQGG